MLWIPLHSQTIQSIILDQHTHRPIAGATIFFNGTSLYALSDEQGRFTLSSKQQINASVIVTHVSYNLQTYPYPYTSVPDTIFLQEKTSDILPVTVNFERYTRQQKMDVFRRHFLGETRPGKSCTILNENDIQVIYDPMDSTLRAICPKPILIYNQYLQYSIQYHLQEFLIQYNRKSLKDRHMIRYRINGSCMFTDQAPDDPIIEKRRAKIYQRSYTAFFYDLLHQDIDNDTLQLSEFRVYGYDSKPISLNATHHFSDSLNLHAVTLNFPPEKIFIGKNNPPQNKIYGQLLVSYKNSILSGIIYRQPMFFLDDFGNFGSDSGIFFEGDMALQRVGNMLPANYRPTDITYGNPWRQYSTIPGR